MSDTKISKLINSKVSVVNSDVSKNRVVVVDQSDTVNNFFFSDSNQSEVPANILSYNSSDTLTIAKTLKKLSKDGIRQCDCIIKVSGYDNYLEENCFIEGISGNGFIDGYVRRLEIEGEGGYFDVGGCNATSERIAADKVEFILSNHAYSHITDTVAQYYDVNLKKELTHNDLKRTEKFNLPQQTIAIAKQLKDEASLKTITAMLYKSSKHKTMSLVTESFKVFSNLFNKNIALANITLHELQSFILRNKTNKDYSIAIIYAIESMAYVVKNHPILRKKHSEFLLGLYTHNDRFSYIHQDILWSTIVSLKGCISTKSSFDKLAGILSEINKNQENSDLIIPIGNKILYDNSALN